MVRHCSASMLIRCVVQRTLNVVYLGMMVAQVVAVLLTNL